MKLLSRLFFVNIVILFSGLNTFSQIYKVLESGTDHIIVEFNFGNHYSVVDTTVEGKTIQKILGEDYSYRSPGDPWVPDYRVLAGIPLNSKPTIKVIELKHLTLKNKFIIPYPEEDPKFVKQDFEKINVDIYSKNEFYPFTFAHLDESYIVRYAKVLPIVITPYQFNPVTRDLVFNSKVIVRVDFNEQSNLNFVNLSDATTDEFLKTSVVNPDVSGSFSGKITLGDSPIIQGDYWYNPNKNYFKIYVKEKDVYRLTYEELISAGVQLGSNTAINQLEMFNDGLPVPIEVFDNNNDLFFGGDVKFIFLCGFYRDFHNVWFNIP